jgi:hypothetical protein
MQIVPNPIEGSAFRLLGDINLFLATLQAEQSEAPWPVVRNVLRFLLLLLPEHIPGATGEEQCLRSEDAATERYVGTIRRLAVILVSREAQQDHTYYGFGGSACTSMTHMHPKYQRASI